MTTSTFPTRIVQIDYRRDATDSDWLHAVAYAGDMRWALAARIPDDDPDGAAARKKLGLAIMTGVQQATARPCDTKGCDRKALNHGDVRLEGTGKDLDVRHVHVCEPCKNAITSTAPAGPVSVLLMPYYAFTEYDD